jgi:segregation and condensation protein B
MPHIVSAIESVLFVASRPLTLEKITQAVGGSVVEVEQALQELSQKYNDQSGVVLIHTDTDWQLVSHKDNQTVAEKFLKAEVSEELTRPQLETLTVISYCGPLTRAELEQIRGVNCSLILRNLMMRGLVHEVTDTTSLLPTYQVTIDYLRFAGLQTVEQLPHYEELHNHEFIQTALKEDKE